MENLIVPIFKRDNKSNPSNDRTIMIIPLLVELYGLILEKKIGSWLKIHDQRAKGKSSFPKIIQL
jgi:hypothetical protein